MYVSLSVSRSGFICMFAFVLFVHMYLPTYLKVGHLHVCGLIQKTFSPSRLSFTFFFFTRDSRSAVPLLIAGRKPTLSMKI